MRIRSIIVALAVALGTIGVAASITATPAGAVSITSTYIPPQPSPHPASCYVAVTAGWVIYVHFCHNAVYGALLTALVYGVGAGMGWACTLITIGTLVPVCLALVGFAAAYIIGLFVQANRTGGGIVLMFTYTGNYDGYMLVGDSWT
jgi:hypothetical protein